MKHTKLRIAVVLFLLLMSSTESHAEGWRGIVPLKSIRADVEHLLGKPHGLFSYKLEEATVYILYAEDICKERHNNNYCACFVSKDTVIYIRVQLRSEIKFSTLKLDRTKYKKFVSPEDPNLISYTNDEEGVIYTVSKEDNEVTAISYKPAEADCNALTNH